MNVEERLKIYNDIQKEIAENHKEEISIQEIDSIVQSQFKIMVYGFTKGIATSIPLIGKFIPIDHEYYKKHVIEPNKRLQRELIAEGREEDAKVAYVASVKSYQSLVSEKKNAATLTAESVIALTNHDNIPETLDIFKNLR